MKTTVELSKVCCLCFGAKHALENAIKAKDEHNNVVLFKQILHNKETIKYLEDLGIVTKQNLFDLTSDDYVIIRAHGEPKSTYTYLNAHNIKYLDCTCPNVLSINKLVESKQKDGYKIIIIGKYGYKTGKIHPEVYATSGWCVSPILIEDENEIRNIDLSFNKYFLVVQTTFSKPKALKIIEKIKDIMQKNNKLFDYKETMCNAQAIIHQYSIELAKKVDKMIIVGGKNSSNTIELYNSVSNFAPTYFAENLDDIKHLISTKKLLNGDYIGLSGGASTQIEQLETIKSYILSKL